jgi:hypothetical protein
MIALVRHRSGGAPVYVGPFKSEEDAALWIMRGSAKDDPTGAALLRELSVVSWGIVRLQDPADPHTPDWSAP